MSLRLRIFISRFAPLAVFWFLSGCAAYGPRRNGEIVSRHVTFATRGHKDLHVDLYLPRLPKPCPAVVWYHGGGWKYGHNGYHLLVRNLTRYGIGVASVEYRLLKRGNPWPAQLEDSLAAVEWIGAHGAEYGIDKHRLGVSGESAGGHLAALVALKCNRPVIDAACLMYPPTDLVALGRRYERFHRLSVFSQMFRGEIEDRLAQAREASPVEYVTRRAPPFLIYHGDRDWLVPPEQSRELDSMLRRNGVESELVVVPGRGHAFSLNDAQIAHVASFFRRSL